MTDVSFWREAIDSLNAALAGRYTVEHEVGRGGMATVYLARDERHHRQVALKLLNPELGAVLGPERFLAEIRVTANLQHPNLLPLFDSGELPPQAGLWGGLLFYVMPFVQGESLRARLDREKQLPVDEAIRIGVQLAGALHYAHEQGVIHRDLKPENILMHAGQPIIADFGIALAVSRAGGARITQSGLSLGTPQYMSPEQAGGDRALDGRTDVYSLAAVVYEMLAGEPPHVGSSAQAIISRVLTEKPRPLRAVRPSVPEHVEDAVAVALEKLPADRFATAGEFASALQGSMGSTFTRRAERARPRRSRLVYPLAGALTLTAAIAASGWYLAVTGSGAQSVGPMHFLVDRPPAARFVEPSPAISPDGRHLAFSGADSTGVSWLWIRPLGSLEARRVPGTEQAIFPFWSPRSDAIGFFSNGKLRVAFLNGDPVRTICDAPRPWGGTWNGDDLILFSPDLRSPLQVVPANGGSPRFVESGGDRLATRQDVAFLPDGRHYVFSIFSVEMSPGVYLGALGDTAITLLRESGPIAVTDDRHLLFVEEGVIRAQRIDVKARRLTGPVISVSAGAGAPVAGGLSVAASGMIAYRTGGRADHQLTWVDRAGRVVGTVGTRGPIEAPELSPDETRVVYGLLPGEVWIADLNRTVPPTRFVTPNRAGYASWSPDGRHIAFTMAGDMWIKAASGAGEPRLLAKGGFGSFGWSSDGNYISYVIPDTATGDDAWFVRLADTTSVPFLITPYNEYEHRFAPEGKRVAYVSEESGIPEVWVTTFPASETRARVSTDGGVQPMWTHDGRGLYYLGLDGKLMFASVASSPRLAAGLPTALFQMNVDVLFSRSSYAPTRDGSRFLVNSHVNVDGPMIGVLTDWRNAPSDRSSQAARR